MRTKRLFFWVVLWAVCGACRRHRTAFEPPRPPKVPAEAVWVGGPDGGVFIDCRRAGSSAEYDCRLYHDHTGDLWDSGRYVGSSEPPLFNPRKAESYQGFDGERIILNDYRTLVKKRK